MNSRELLGGWNGSRFVHNAPAPAGANIADTLEADLKQLIYLDQLGYSEAWIGEHYTAEWENIPAPDLLIA
ncbi:MAG TPA: hypothetical protein EYQ61_09560 [Dehalococcoidia bacterium]|nr:hypothetical protein [Dehalococcoidia bacterium]